MKNLVMGFILCVSSAAWASGATTDTIDQESFVAELKGHFKSMNGSTYFEGLSEETGESCKISIRRVNEDTYQIAMKVGDAIAMRLFVFQESHVATSTETNEEGLSLYAYEFSERVDQQLTISRADDKYDSVQMIYDETSLTCTSEF